MDDLLSRGEEYARTSSTTIQLTHQLGFGNDGRVWATNRATAVKVFQRQANNIRERDCYQRLLEDGVEDKVQIIP